MQKRFRWLIGLSLFLNLIIIGALLFTKIKAESRLQKVAGMLNRLGNSDIDYIVHVEDTLDIKTNFNINKAVPVMVAMDVKYNLDFKQIIPVNQIIQTPIKLMVNQNIRVDTGFLFKDKIIVPLDEIIHVDQKFKVVFNKENKKGINIPIIADIPLKQNISLNIKDPIPVLADIPIKIPISQTIPVHIEMHIPVDLDLPLDIPVNSHALITFPESLPVTGRIPLNLDIPVKIPLSATPIKSKSDSIAVELQNLLKL